MVYVKRRMESMNNVSSANFLLRVSPSKVVACAPEVLHFGTTEPDGFTLARHVAVPSTRFAHLVEAMVLGLLLLLLLLSVAISHDSSFLLRRCPTSWPGRPSCARWTRPTTTSTITRALGRPSSCPAPPSRQRVATWSIHIRQVG